MTESKAGFELISGPSSGGPGTVEDLLRLENPGERVKKLQDWMVGAFNADTSLVTDIGGTTEKEWGEASLPTRLTRESFPILLAETSPTMHIGVNSMSRLTAYLDFLQPHGKFNEILPLLVMRVLRRDASVGSSKFAKNREMIENAGLFHQKGWERLLEMGLPLDVALWQVSDHSKMGKRVNDLMSMRPIVYINGQSQMETATEDELLKLPGVIMRVNGVTRFYVADPEYKIEYTEE